MGKKDKAEVLDDVELAELVELAPTEPRARLLLLIEEQRRKNIEPQVTFVGRVDPERLDFSPAIDRSGPRAIERCFSCKYDGDTLKARCEFHTAKPDDSTHGALALELEQLGAGAGELAIDRDPVLSTPEVIGEAPCYECHRGFWCTKHSGQTRSPYVAAPVDEGPLTPRNP